ALPQAPQLARSRLTSTSQPLATLPSQSAKPARQEKSHAPPWQVDVAFGRRGQELPQAPQLLTSSRGVSHPSLRLSPLQSAKPGAQTPDWHEPSGHEGATWLNEQAASHAPQLTTSSSLLSQPSLASPLQSAKPAAQVSWHWPLTHTPEAV